MNVTRLALALSALIVSTHAIAAPGDVTLSSSCYDSIVNKARAEANKNIEDESDQYNQVMSVTTDNKTHYRVRLMGDTDAELFLVEIRITKKTAKGTIDCVAMSAQYVSGGGEIPVGQ